MSRKPSAETELRRLKRYEAFACEQIERLSSGLDDARMRLVKAEQETVEWKARFDALLAACRETGLLRSGQ